MEKEQYRSVIRFLFLDGKKCEEIREKLIEVYKDQSPSMTTIRYWFNEFKRGRTSVFDEDRPGRPTEVTTEEIVDKIHDIVMEDRRMKVREISNMVNISTERVHNILHNELAMRKLSARWVPRLLTVDQKRVRMQMSKLSLSQFKRNKKEFLRRYVTVDETWIHHYTPEMKIQSAQWVFPNERAPKKAKTTQSAGKVMATVFWDSKGIIHIDYLPKGQTITGEYYCNVLEQFDKNLKEKRPHLARKKVLFHHDNAPAHSSAIATAKLVELRYELLPHPPYSPDLAPSDFFLFPNLKKWLGGKRFTSNEEVISETEAYFAEFDESYFLSGLEKLEHRWDKCIKLRGDYVEK